MLITTLSSQQKTLVINQYTRPSNIERIVKQYWLVGFKCDIDFNYKDENIIFERKYVMIIEVDKFIASIQGTFYEATQAELNERYPIKVKKKSVREETAERMNGIYAKDAVILLRRKIEAPA